MKQFFKGLIECKLSACAMFTAAVFLYLCVCLVYGNREVSTALLWGLFWVSAAGAVIQALCFSDWITKKMRYTWRSLLFVLLFLPVLSLAAWKTEWFPADQTGAWALFIVIFFLTFLVMTVGFDLYFRVTGRKYDGLLGQYRKEKEDAEDGD